jgi:hypothetical protein
MGTEARELTREEVVVGVQLPEISADAQLVDHRPQIQIEGGEHVIAASGGRRKARRPKVSTNRRAQAALAFNFMAHSGDAWLHANTPEAAQATESAAATVTAQAAPVRSKRQSSLSSRRRRSRSAGSLPLAASLASGHVNAYVFRQLLP